MMTLRLDGQPEFSMIGAPDRPERAMMQYSKELSDRREVFDRAMGRCQCTRHASCHRPRVAWHAARCVKWFDFWQDGWTISYRVALEDGGTDEVGNKLLLCKSCAEKRERAKHK